MEIDCSINGVYDKCTIIEMYDYEFNDVIKYK